MNTKKSSTTLRGFTLVEALVALVVILGVGLLAVGFVFVQNAKARAIRMSCVNNLKQCGIAFEIWASDHQGKLPMEVPKEQGGSLGWPPEGNAFHNFQVMSNELSTTIVIWCPAETRLHATNWIDLNNQNVSYFVNLDASTNNPSAWLCGDRNITNQPTPNHSVLTVQTGQSPGWTEALHNNCGNVAFVDGAVEQWSTRDLHKTVKQADWTNHLVLPE